MPRTEKEIKRDSREERVHGNPPDVDDTNRKSDETKENESKEE